VSNEHLFFQSEENIEKATVGVSRATDAATMAWLSSLQHVTLVKTADPKAAAEAGEVQMALELSDAFADKLNQGVPAAITIYAEQSSMKVSRAMDLFLQELTAKEEAIVADRLGKAGIDPNQVKPFAIQVKALSENDEASILLLSVLFPLIIVMSVMLGGFSSAVDLFAGEKERKTMEALLITPVSRMKLILAKWLTISTLGTVSGIFAIAAFVLITKTVTTKLAAELDYGSQTLLIFFSTVVGIVFFAILFATIQMMISILSNTFKEAQNYISPVMFIALVPYFLLIGVAPHELESIHFLVPGQ
jgi:sodium transport system permease protein